jgi:hypothetical protein
MIQRVVVVRASFDFSRKVITTNYDTSFVSSFFLGKEIGMLLLVNVIKRYNINRPREKQQ